MGTHVPRSAARAAKFSKSDRRRKHRGQRPSHATNGDDRSRRAKNVSRRRTRASRKWKNFAAPRGFRFVGRELARALFCGSARQRAAYSAAFINVAMRS
jgi:hypothetical protein